MLKIYLAGPISNCSYKEATEWRIEVINSLSSIWKVFDPLTGHEKLSGIENIDAFSEGVDPLTITQKAIVTKDRFMIQQADVVLFNFSYGDKTSIGSCVELGWANAWGKTCIVILPSITVTSKYHHPFIYELAHCVTSLEDALHILSYYEPSRAFLASGKH